MQILRLAFLALFLGCCDTTCCEAGDIVPSICNEPRNGVVVLTYHRFGASQHPTTSVNMDMVQDHIRFFRENNFTFVSLQDIAEFLTNQRPFPEKAVAVTIDDASISLYDSAHSVFMENNIPYSVFVNTEAVDRRYEGYMSWDKLRQIASNKLVSLEAQGHRHAHMIREMNSVQRSHDIETSVRRLYEEINTLPQFFSYPYGETSMFFMEEIKSYLWDIDGKQFSFTGAFATHSGPVGCRSNPFALPRFELNMRYGRIDPLFRHKMHSLPFPLESFNPPNFSFCSSSQHNKFVVTASRGIDLSNLQCFSTNGNVAIGATMNRAEIRLERSLILNSEFGNFRERLNCTMPSEQRGRFFWLGRQFSLLSC